MRIVALGRRLCIQLGAGIYMTPFWTPRSQAAQYVGQATALERIASNSSRNKAIARARSQGASLQAIGTAVGLSRERVRQIVAGTASNSRDQRKFRRPR